MNGEYTLENIKSIISDVFNMNLVMMSVNADGIEHFHYYKSVKSTEFDMLREYRLVVSDDGHSFKINYDKKINGKSERNNTKEYNQKDGWEPMVYDFVMKTFGTMDSYCFEDIENGLDIILRQRKIDNLLEDE